MGARRARRRRHRLGTFVVVLLGLVAGTGAMVGWSIRSGRADGLSLSWTSPATTMTPVRESVLAEAPEEPGGTEPAESAPVTGSATATGPTDMPPTDSGVTAEDWAAGIRSLDVPDRGTGAMVPVAGSVPAPGAGTVIRVRVEVEQGLDVDGDKFADFVMDTLNDPRSWGHDGHRTFARTSSAADIRVVLASPETSQALCAPLRTMGTLSCAMNGAAILTMYRWVNAIPDYGSDRTGYRHYVVNHEVGHLLGHGHKLCPGTGEPAPVMMQQTKGLKGCEPNPWPNP